MLRQNKRASDSAKLIQHDPNAKPWEKAENHQQLLSQFADAYLHYKSIANRRQLEIKPRKGPGAGDKLVGAEDGDTPQQQADDQDFSDFYLRPNLPQLLEPDKQIKYREAYIAEVGARPEPEALHFLSDTLQKEELETVKDRSQPSETRQELSAFFRRYGVQLQHRKHKMLARYAALHKSSLQVDMAGDHFEQMLSRLQRELDSALNRCHRLNDDDFYDEAIGDPALVRPDARSKEEGEG